MSMIVHIVGMTALTCVTVIMFVMMAVIRRCYVATVIVGRIDVGLDRVGLADGLRATLLEAAAASTATPTPTTAPCAAFTMTFVTTGLARLRRAVLLQGDLLVQCLLAQALGFGLDGSDRCWSRHGNWCDSLRTRRLRTAFLTLAAVTAFVAIASMAFVAILALALAPFWSASLRIAIRTVLAARRIATLALALTRCLAAIATLTAIIAVAATVTTVPIAPAVAVTVVAVTALELLAGSTMLTRATFRHAALLLAAGAE
jgi:hypothetical protein